MSQQTLEYIKEMKETYDAIIKKYLNEGEITSTDKLFIEIYKKLEKGE